jgi:transcriptional regulator GlxA family with amidase domain
MDRRVALVIAFMHTELARPLTVAELALQVRLSPSWLTRLFKVETGVTPACYLQQLRLARARAELEHVSQSVDVVAALVGFRDPARFADLFRRQFGFTPEAAHTRGARRRG